MKKIFRFLSVMLITGAFTACVDDIETPDRGQQSNPEKEIQGTYSGVWTVTYVENGVETVYTANGTLSVAPKGEQAYAGIISAKANFTDAVGFNLDLASPVNISPLTNAGSFQVYNSVTPNGFTKEQKNIDGTVVEVEVTKEDGSKVMEPVELSTTLMGQVYPLNAAGERVKADPSAFEVVFDFTYTYQKEIIVNRRPRKVDCKEIYNFNGLCNK